MLKQRLLFILLCLTLIFGHSAIIAQEDARPLLLAHYMPWYQTPAVSGYWGWHWTMEHFNPRKTNADGDPEVASHYMPLTGPYDSQDEAVLEYQVLLMKLSGIDGIIVDWYGTEDFRDYKVLNKATGKIFEYSKRAGLRFVICYEDQTVKHMLTEGHIASDEAIPRAQEDMLHIQENWSNDPAYVRFNDQPLLFIFGPQQFRSPSDWEAIFSPLDTPMSLVTLNAQMDFAALTGYPWPPMNMAGGAKLAPAAMQAYLELFYRNARRNELIVGSAFPSFHDIYKEAGVRSSYGYLDPEDGAILQQTIDLALASNVDLLQLVTWNDYGEGTMIEPTKQTGYKYLEIVQNTRRTLDTADFAFTAEDLTLPLQLYTLRKAHRADADIQVRLDEVFHAIVAGDLAAARAILEEFQSN